MSNDTVIDDTERGDELAGRLFLGGLAALELLTVHIGVRLDLYAALRASGGLTSAELADAAGIDERYGREWLEQQAVASFVDVDDPSLASDQRTYRLPAGHEDVFLDPESFRYSAAIPEFVVSFTSVLDDLAEAFRAGRGIPYARYGTAMRDAQGAFNRPLFRHLLTAEWLPNALPDLHATLTNAATPRVADIGCGVGWSSIALGRAYPRCVVDGVDSDVASIDQASKHAADAGVGGRVTFRVHEAADPLPATAYDAVFIFEALHDMAQPVAALTAARQMLRPGGVCVVMDEKVADDFTAPGDEVERFMFASSVLHCLPVGRATEPSAGTGTMLRRGTLDQYATEAGFRPPTTLSVEHDFFRLYRLEA